MAWIAVLSLLAALSGCGSSPLPPPAKVEATAPEAPLTPAQVAAVQSILAKRGYDPGPVDGMMGPKTARSIARYQRDNRLEADGAATAGLIRHLQGQPDSAPQVVAVEAVIPASRYPVGTRFVYSGAETHSVTGVEGGRIAWETNIGDHYVTGPHFGLPELEWRSGTWRGTAESTLPPETSWPPNQGVGLYFDVTSTEWNQAEGKNPRRQVSDASWSCNNKGPKNIKVPAGSFTTQAVLCERSPAPAGAWQKRIWYYVPAVGHFVRRHDFDGAGLEIARLDLIAILPGGGSKTLRKGREGAVQDALDRLAPGQTTVWSNPAGPERYVIKVNSRFNGKAGSACRTYSVIRQDIRPPREYPALACRGKGKRRWVTPDRG